MCSSPLDENLELVYAIKYTEGFTQFLAEHLKTGSLLNVKGPYGNFVLKENDNEKIFISTGAGIAPLISMMRFLIQTKAKNTIKFFYGFRNTNQFLYKKELEKFAKLKNFEFLPTISREDPSWKGHKGYVQTLLEYYDFKNNLNNMGSAEIYICGNPVMMEEVKAILFKKGFSKEQINIEIW